MDPTKLCVLFAGGVVHLWMWIRVGLGRKKGKVQPGRGRTQSVKGGLYFIKFSFFIFFCFFGEAVRRMR